jgi:hypothetical protein
VFNEQLALKQGTVLVDTKDCSLDATRIYASGLLISDDTELTSVLILGHDL